MKRKEELLNHHFNSWKEKKIVEIKITKKKKEKRQTVNPISPKQGSTFF